MIRPSTIDVQHRSDPGSPSAPSTAAELEAGGDRPSGDDPDAVPLENRLSGGPRSASDGTRAA